MYSGRTSILEVVYVVWITVRADVMVFGRSDMRTTFCEETYPFRRARKNELRPNQAKMTVKHIAATKRLETVLWRE